MESCRKSSCKKTEQKEQLVMFPVAWPHLQVSLPCAELTNKVFDGPSCTKLISVNGLQLTKNEEVEKVDA